MVAYVVPGTVTLKQVVRPATGETPAQRLHRLAAKAQIEGCQVFRIHGADTMFVVTSANAVDTVYAVDTERGDCSCEGFARWQVCKHVAAVLNALGELPEPEPPAPAAAVAAARADVARIRSFAKTSADWRALERAKERLVAAMAECPECHGDGTVDRDDCLGRSWTVTCPTCHGGHDESADNPTDYPNAAEFAGLVALAKRRGVTIAGTADRPIAIDPRPKTGGRFDVTAVSCSCRGFAFVGACAHHALFLDSLAQREALPLAA